MRKESHTRSPTYCGYLLVPKMEVAMVRIAQPMRPVLSDSVLVAMVHFSAVAGEKTAVVKHCRYGAVSCLIPSAFTLIGCMAGI